MQNCAPGSLALGFVTTLIVTDHFVEDYSAFVGREALCWHVLGLGAVWDEPSARALHCRPTRGGGVLVATVAVLRVFLCALFASVVVTRAEFFDYMPAHRSPVYAFIVINLLGYSRRR